MDHELHGHHQHQEKHGPLIPPPYCYGDFSPSGHHPGMQSLEPGHELIGLQSGMEMLGIPSKHHHQNPDAWRAFFPKAGGSSGAGPAFSQASSDDLMIAPETAASAITNPWQQPQQQNRMMVDDSSLRCLFPIEGSQQPPAQRLSLSLFNPEQQQPPFHQHLTANPRDGFFSRPANLQPPDERLFDPPTLYPHPPQMRGSQFLAPAQELLNEICSLGGNVRISKPEKPRRGNEWEEGGSSSSSTPNQSLKSMDLLELQKHKARLLSMLEEVDRRYTRYCDQMRSVVSAFEAVAGEGAATVYSTLASKAMSRHFRSLRDGVVGRIQATRKAMGEKDPVTPGSTRGETPRLRLLDQSLRQQKALQQAGMMENHPWRPQRGLPERSVSVLRAWLFEHFLHPYPSDVDKHILARQTGLSRSQVSNWFINARVRLWKPMVEEMYVEETKEQDNRSPHAAVGYVENNSSGQPGQLQSNRSPNPNPNPSTSQLEAEEQKPAAPGQLLNDSDSLSSIINSSHRYDDGQNRPRQGHLRRPQPSAPGRAENFGVVDMDFSSPYGEGGNPGFGSGVSLTLGLQQHDGGGVSLAFSSAAQHHDFFFSRESMDGCQPVEFTITEDEAQNLPYRNLMGAQLLHDLAGG